MSSKDQGKKPGSSNQGKPNQGKPNQGKPNQEKPNQGKPNQGKQNQGQHNQHKSNQGKPNQGKSSQGQPNQCNSNKGNPNKQLSGNSKVSKHPGNKGNNEVYQQHHQSQGSGPQLGIQSLVQNVISGILSGNQASSSGGHVQSQPTPNSFNISFNLDTPNFSTGVSFQRGQPAPFRGPSQNNRGGFRPPGPRGPRPPNVIHHQNNVRSSVNDSFRGRSNAPQGPSRAKGSSTSSNSSKPTEVRVFTGSHGYEKKNYNQQKIQLGKKFNNFQQFSNFQKPFPNSQMQSNFMPSVMNNQNISQTNRIFDNSHGQVISNQPSFTTPKPLLSNPGIGGNASASGPVYKFKKAKTPKKNSHANTAIEKAKNTSTPSGKQTGDGSKFKKRKQPNLWKKNATKKPEVTLFSFQSSTAKTNDVFHDSEEEESSTLSRCSSYESVFTNLSDEDEESDESETSSETSGISSLKDRESTCLSQSSLVSTAQGIISVFWDIENCPVPVECSATDFVKQVRSKFHEGRTEADFWVVSDVKNMNLIISDELGSADVTTVHVDGRSKNAADAKIVSLLQDFRDKYKQDNLAIVLISGDSDFAPTLNNMNYKYLIKINLICRNNSRHSLIASAHKSVFYEDFIEGLPKRKKGELIEYLIKVSNFPAESKEEVKTKIGFLLRGVNCRLKILKKNSIEIVFPHESARSRASSLLENFKIENIQFQLNYMQRNITSTSEQPSQKEKKAVNKSNLVENKEKMENKENVESNTSTSKGAILCIFVCEKVGDLQHWQKEFEKLWSTADFMLQWEGGLYDGYFLASFKSLRQAQKARKILEKAQINNTTAPKFLKLIKEDNISSSLMPRNASVESFEDKNKKKIDDHIRMIESKKISSVAKHKKIIDDLKTIANPSISGSSESVASKKAELNEQLVNYLNYTYNAIEKLKKLDLSSNIDEILIDILRDYSRECNCITNALPIYAKKNNILKKIRSHQVVVIRAETGSGKSTQLAQYIWRDQFLSQKGLIVCTQPRKIAAITLAKHVSSQLNYKLGDIVGYQVGMAIRKSAKTSILYVTDFAMLKMIISDEVKDISVIIVDEAHERTLYTDLLLGMIKSLLPTRPNLKLVITSATIETSVFSSYFGLSSDAILEVSGRTFPIEDVWLNENVSLGWDYFTKSMNTVCTLIDGEPGDILVFLTTPFETEKAVKVLGERLNKKTLTKVKILQLHGRLDVEEQQKVFERTPSGIRKIVFATNCAETSVTVPGVIFVIDCGMVKESHYDAVRNMSVMSVNFVSQSSAEQRRGRAGRTQSGKCFRLYSKSNYDNMVKSTDPEILRVNLGQALLKLMKIGVTDPLQFDFVQSPPRESLNHAMNQLIELNAVNLFDLSLTDLGDQMSYLPLEPRLSHLVFRGINVNLGYEAVALAALITISRSIFFRTAENKSEADTKKMRFCQSESDFLTFFEVYKEWSSVPKQSKSKWCTLNCINARSLRTAHELVNELVHVLEREVNLKVPSKFSDEPVQEELLKLIFLSFFQNLCIFSGYHRYGYKSPSVSGNLQIHPSSSLSTFGRWRPEFLVYDTILKTDQTYLINVSPVSRDIVTECVGNIGLSINVQDFDDLKLTTYAISPIGKVILLRDLIGKKGAKRKLIENELKKCVGTDYLVLDIEVDKGELKIMGPHSKYNEISEIVCPIIEKGQETLFNEEKEVIIYPELCAIISAGINIKEVIVPGEFRDIKVSLKSDTEITSVVQKLGTCGQVISVREWKNYFKVTFPSPMHAKLALENFKNDSSFSLNKITKFFANDRSNQYKIMVSFLRRPCTGVAYITVDSSEATSLVLNKFQFQPVFYQNSLLKFSVHRKTGDIQVHNLPPQTERNNFMDFINSQIKEYGKVNKCVIPRKSGYESSHEEIGEIRKKLLEMFGEFTSKGKLFINLKKPTTNDVKWNAIVFFENSHHGETALAVLKSKSNPLLQNFQIKATLQTFLYCKIEVFNAIKDQIQNALEYFKKSAVEGNTLDIVAVPKGNMNCEIEITSNNLADMYDARRCILNFLLGDSIACHGPMVKFFTGIGQEFIQNVTKTISSCYVELNYQKKVLTIFGDDSACSVVKYKINEFLNKLEEESFEEISLMPDKGKPGVIKELLKKYGPGLDELKKICDLTNIEINSRKHIMKVMGSVTSISKCQEIINELKVQMGGNILTEDEETCPICFSSVSENFHRLEFCGHVYCTDCILHLLQSSEDFPLICSMEDCGAMIVLADIDWAVKEMKYSTVSLYKNSLTAFVKNREDVSFCPSPDCPMIFRVTSIENTFDCPTCSNSICTKCKEIFHYGMSCNLYQAYKKDKDVGLKVWLQADPSNRKKCPKCSSPIEKNEGCNHMTCYQCKSHMCWLCLRIFPTGEQVYYHQPYCPSKQ